MWVLVGWARSRLIQCSGLAVVGLGNFGDACFCPFGCPYRHHRDQSFVDEHVLEAALEQMGLAIAGAP